MIIETSMAFFAMFAATFAVVDPMPDDSTCVLEVCADAMPAPYCLARVYQAGSGYYYYAGCNYPHETCAAAMYDARNQSNTQYGCVELNNAGCTLRVAVSTIGEEGYDDVLCL